MNLSDAETTEPRNLNLEWGWHRRKGMPHEEWYAPCGCAYHPEPYPHVHPCSHEHSRPEPFSIGLKRHEEIAKLKAEVERLKNALEEKAEKCEWFLGDDTKEIKDGWEKIKSLTAAVERLKKVVDNLESGCPNCNCIAWNSSPDEGKWCMLCKNEEENKSLDGIIKILREKNKSLTILLDEAKEVESLPYQIKEGELQIYRDENGWIVGYDKDCVEVAASARTLVEAVKKIKQHAKLNRARRVK